MESRFTPKSVVVAKYGDLVAASRCCVGGFKRRDSGADDRHVPARGDSGWRNEVLVGLAHFWVVVAG